MSKDLFAPVPEFLAAFNNLLENGFFEGIQFHAGGKLTEGVIHGCSITISGCVPSGKQYKMEGCGAIIDPNAVIDSCRKLADQNKVKEIMTKVETENWPLWDADGENIIGSKGKRTELFLYITFET